MSRAREFADLAGSADAGGLTGRNLIINGAMQVWQRQTAATAAANTYNTVDRFRINNSTDGAYTSEQSTDTPSGTGYSLKLQVTTADTSMSAAQNAYLFHAIEAQNLQHLNYGTSDAKTVTLSFWVKSSKTGTYAVAVLKQDNTGCMFTHEYTVSSANTWEKKTITITPTAGGTSLITSAGGAIDNDNGTGLRLVWGLAWGSNFTNGTNNSWASTTSANYSTTNAVNWMDSTSNNFYLADVQLELGDTATPFEHRSYGDELARCQRYYEKSYSDSTAPGTITITGVIRFRAASNGVEFPLSFLVKKRSAPTVTLYSYATGASGNIRDISAGLDGAAAVASIGEIWCFPTKNTLGTDGNQYAIHFTADAEL